MDERTDRRDDAVKGTGFRAWLRDLRAEDPDGVGEFSALYYIIDDTDFPVAFDFAAYGEIMEDRADNPAVAAAQTSMLIHAERAWRADTRARMAARAHLGLGPKSGSALPTGDVECGFTFRNGSNCHRTVVPGSPRCSEHGGMLIDPETRQSVLMVAYTRLVEGSETAVDALVDVAEHGRNEIARVMAAKEILDRVGISPELRITVTPEISEEERMDTIRGLLEKTRERISASAIDVESHELTPGTSDELPEESAAEDGGPAELIDLEPDEPEPAVLADEPIDVSGQEAAHG